MELQRHARCVIFDLDGTLGRFDIDYDAIKKELGEFFSKYGRVSSFKPLVPEIRKLTSELKDEKILEHAFKIIDKYEEKSIMKSSVVEPARKLYEECLRKGTDVVILTRNSRRMVDLFLEKHGFRPPDLICSREDSVLLKPSPEHFKLIDEAYRYERKDYLIIGDSWHDKVLAEKLGIRFINTRDL